MVINQNTMRDIFTGRSDYREDFTDREVITLIKERVEWLISHNKNYTAQQWIRLLDIEDMLDAIEF